MSKNIFELGLGKTESQIQNVPLKTKGNLPEWLQGTLIRNGPGTFEVGNEKYRHWFDGLAMLHKFTFKDRKVIYSNKFLDTKSYQEAMDAGKIVYSEFATDPQWSFIDRIKNVFSPKITDSAKVNVTKIHDQFMALAETPIQVLFDPHTLETLGTFTYENNLVGQMTTVHPQFNQDRTTAYNLVTRYHQTSHYRIYQLKNGLNPKMIASIPVKKPAYMHSFGMSQNYIILTEFPLIVNSLALLLWLKPYIENYHWTPKKGTRFTIINRHTGEIVHQSVVDPFFAFHHINAFELGDQLIVDIDAYEDSNIIQSFYLDQLKLPNSKIPFGKIHRYQIPLKGKQITSQVISDTCIELPNFDVARFNTLGEYQYIYGVSINPQARRGFYNQLAKLDIYQKNDAVWYQAGNFPGEPVFVGRPDRTKEDDGIILSVVLDEESGSSFLLVLDAQSFSEIARVEIPQTILFGYHGAFFSNIMLNEG